MPNIYRGREGLGKAVRRQERDEWFRHNPRDSWSHQKLEGTTLKPPEGTSPADNQDFRLLASRTMGE